MGTYDTRGGSPHSDPAFDQSEICEGCANTASECFCPEEKAPTPAQLKLLTMLRDGRQPKFYSFHGGGQYYRGDTNRGVFDRCRNAGWLEYVMPKEGELTIHGRPRLSGRYELTKLGRAQLPPNAKAHLPTGTGENSHE